MISKITAADILKVVPITRKTLWLWQKKYHFFPDPKKEGHPGGKGIIGYYPSWVKERCKLVYSLQKKGYTIGMIQEYLKKDQKEKSIRKILIVNNEVKFSNNLKNILKKNDFLIETAKDGWEAGKKTSEFQPTIIILDITLPGINGLQVCKNLRADPKTEKIKIIAIAADLKYSEAEILQAGAKFFFTMPVSFENLVSLCKDFVAFPKFQIKS